MKKTEKIICYVDGYNFYHATKDNPSAKTDFQSLALSLLKPKETHKGVKVLVEVHYFSAFAP